MGYIEAHSASAIFILFVLAIALAIIVRRAFRKSTHQLKIADQKSPANSWQLTISETCECIFRQSNNHPLTLNDLHEKLVDQGTICSRAALEFILLDDSLKFSVDHSRKRSLYRLSLDHLVQNP